MKSTATESQQNGFAGLWMLPLVATGPGAIDPPVRANAPLMVCHANHCRAAEDMVLLAHIREQHRLSVNSDGRPRMTEALKELGLDVGHRRVGRLMRQNGVTVVRTREYKVTTDSNHSFNIAPNLLNRNFSADRVNQKWVVDISYVWTHEGWLYLAAVLDLYSRRVIGWAVSNRMKRDPRPGK